MNLRTRFLAVVFGALSATLLAQQTTQQTTTTTTTRNVTGSVVQYTPGQTIVLRSADGKTTTYTIPSAVTVPADVEIGRSVTISTQPASDGSGPAIVTKIVTTSVSADGTRTTTERTESQPSSQSDQTTQTTTTTTVTGKVMAFQPKQSITVEEPGKAAVTYVIDPESQLPQDLAVGKTVTVTTRVVKGSPVVRTVTTKTVTTETKPQ
ncbi:MAG TPA: hypothetical protein VKG23_20635 [Thermoanaerobaculia bacterium]|nr:hypothetical protein [Thermoanaerobaculia bacterium]